ncbi:MAG: VWA domain-containing protein, partial [Rhodothermales bacterium]|nr:VWA domain-containing protein [Rhodothermales bacterium]
MRRRQTERPYGVRVASATDASRLPLTAAVRWRGLPGALRYAALALMLVALARPQEQSAVRTRSTEGVDILLVLDTSTSMNATDLFPSRFEAAQSVASDFIRGRTSDRIGLVVFAAKAFTQAPLTLDYPFLQRMLAMTQTGMLEDGTAIGSALATAVARLRDATAKSKVVILLTDGQNNRGEVDPETAAAVAEAEGVRVYAVGVGDPSVQAAEFGVDRRPEIDETTLRGVAERTGGRYYLATSRDALAGIYDEISRLETS